MNSLNYLNYSIADVECENVRVEPAVGRHRLLLNLKFGPKNWESSGQLKGYVPFVTSLRVLVKLNGAVVGTAFPEEENFLPPVHPGTPNTIAVLRSFALDVERYTLDKIEQERKGQGIAFDLEVLGTGTVCRLQDVNSQQASSLPKPFGIESLLFEPQLAKTSIRHTVPQSDWIKLLDQMGYARTLLFEIPWPEDAEDELADAVSYFEGARAAFLSGFYTDAVVKLRKSLESACSTIDFEDSMNKVWSKVSGEKKMKDMELGERFLLAWSSVRHLTNSAAHPGENYSREEARYILGMGALALSLAANAPGVLTEASNGRDDAG